MEDTLEKEELPVTGHGNPSLDADPIDEETENAIDAALDAAMDGEEPVQEEVQEEVQEKPKTQKKEKRVKASLPENEDE